MRRKSSWLPENAPTPKDRRPVSDEPGSKYERRYDRRSGWWALVDLLNAAWPGDGVHSGVAAPPRSPLGYLANAALALVFAAALVAMPFVMGAADVMVLLVLVLLAAVVLVLAAAWNVSVGIRRWRWRASHVELTGGTYLKPWQRTPPA